MAALWCDGFDHYGAAGDEAKLLDTYAEANGSLVTTPVNTLQSAPGVTARSFALGPLGGLRRSLGGDFTTVGFKTGLYMTNLPVTPGGGLGAGYGAWCVHQFRNIQNRSHINIMIGTTGRVEIWGGALDRNSGGGSTLLARSTKEMAAGVYYNVETKVFMGAVAGTVEVRVNNKVFVTYTGNTERATAGDATISQVFMGLSDGTTAPTFVGLWYTDDWAAWNDVATDAQGNAALITDFIGNYGVYYLPPIADSTPEQWSLTSGADSFELVNEIPPNENTDYLFATATAKKTALQPAALPVNITDIAFVAPIARMRKTDNGDCDVLLGLISGGTEEEDAGGGDALTTSYQYYQHPWEQDPDTGVAWNPLALPFIQVNRNN